MYALTAEQTGMVVGANAGDATAAGAITVGLAGAAAGAEDGGIAGSIAGPVGAAVGLVAGAIVGGAIGLGAYEIGHLFD